MNVRTSYDESNPRRAAEKEYTRLLARDYDAEATRRRLEEPLCTCYVEAKRTLDEIEWTCHEQGSAFPPQYDVLCDFVEVAERAHPLDGETFPGGEVGL